MQTEIFRRLVESSELRDSDELAASMLVLFALNPRKVFTVEQVCSHLGFGSSRRMAVEAALEALERSWAGAYLVLEGSGSRVRVSLRERHRLAMFAKLGYMAGHYGFDFAEAMDRMIPHRSAPVRPAVDPEYWDDENDMQRPFLRIKNKDGDGYKLQVFTHPLHLVLLWLRNSDDEPDALDEVPVQDLLGQYQTQLSLAHRFGAYSSVIVASHFTPLLLARARTFSSALLTDLEYHLFWNLNTNRGSETRPTVEQWSRLVAADGPRFRLLLELLDGKVGEGVS